jgi:hypothetical protein
MGSLLARPSSMNGAGFGAPRGCDETLARPRENGEGRRAVGGGVPHDFERPGSQWPTEGPSVPGPENSEPRAACTVSRARAAMNDLPVLPGSLGGRRLHA